MTTRIINRGRGPEIEGTRITVYRIMDFVRDQCSLTTIADELALSEAQVQAAFDYITAHRSAVEAAYDQLLLRVQQANPPHIQADRAQSLDELKRRIHARRLKDVDHAPLDRSRRDRCGQSVSTYFGVIRMGRLDGDSCAAIYRTSRH